MTLITYARRILALGGVLMLLPLTEGFAASATEKQEVALRQAFPKISIESMAETDIKGLYQVVSGNKIYYYYPDKDYLFVGDIYTKEGKSIAAEKKMEIAARLTIAAEKKKEITAGLIKTLPLEKAVKVGNGKKKIIEITDPDCPYCKKASAFFKDRTDVTRYIFFAPLAHPAAISKIYYILNADDKEKAYLGVMDNTMSVPSDATYSEAVKALAQEHLNLAKKVGVEGTPTFYVNGTLVVGANIPQLELLLKDDGLRK